MCNYCDNLAKKHGWENPKEGQLRVWHIPQLPMEPFHFHVNTVEEAKLLLDALGQYDLFQWQHDIKPDYSNANGLEMYDSDPELGWGEWYDEHGRDIGELMDDDELHAWEAAKGEGEDD